nr:putative retrotransposon Ty1-copia subclass protein [Tanacetum cinerariifolium]
MICAGDSLFVAESIPWCMIFTYDSLLVAESTEGLNNVLKSWRRYLRLMIHRSRRVKYDVAYRVRVGWVKWRAVSRVLCDRKVPLKLKGKFYQVTVRPAMLYGSKCWLITKAQSNRVERQVALQEKDCMDGAVYIFKARLVAKGFTQTYGVNYEETFSPVADIRAIRILIAIAAYYDYEIWKMDVKTAFLNGHLSEEVYMEQPEDWICIHSKWRCY